MSAILSYKKYGITRTQLHSLCINLFHFPNEYMDCLWDYFAKTYSGKGLANALDKGTITEHNREFLVVFHQCVALDACRAQKVHISFRVPQKEFNLPAFALVKILEK